MSPQTWILFAAAYLATTLSPGPNVLLVVRNTVRYGTRGTATTIAGNLLTQLVIVILVALGVGAVLAAIPPLFIGMKVVGALYLMYLGFKQFRASQPKDESSTEASFSRTPGNRRVFMEAILVSGSNPKTLIFLSAFMPQFVDHSRPMLGQFFMMYVTIACIVAVVHAIYSVSARKIHAGFHMSRWVTFIKRGSGLVFFALGIRLLTAQRT